MGIVLDTSFLILHERSRLSVAIMLEGLSELHRDDLASISSITVTELTHGIRRAPSLDVALRRTSFLDDICSQIEVHPVSIETARIGGEIEGDLASAGTPIGLADLLIAATAIHLTHSILTLNPKHFRLIPGLSVLTP